MYTHRTRGDLVLAGMPGTVSHDARMSLEYGDDLAGENIVHYQCIIISCINGHALTDTTSPGTARVDVALPGVIWREMCADQRVQHGMAGEGHHGCVA